MMLLLDSAYPASSMSARSFARLDPVLPVSDSSHLEFLMSTQSSAETGFPPSVCGLGRFDSLTLLLDFVTVDSAVFLRAFSQTGSVSPILDSSHPDFPPSTRSCACLAFPLLLLDLSMFGSPMPTHCLGRVDSGMSVFGRSCYDSLMPVSDFLRLGPSMPVQSLGRCGFAIFVSDFLHLDSSMLPRSCA